MTRKLPRFLYRPDLFRVRTLILLSICAAFAAVPYLEAKLDGVELKKPILRSTAGWLVGMIACWVLVRVVGIFDNWGR